MAIAPSRLLFFLSAKLILIVQATAQPEFLGNSCSADSHTSDSTYATNLKPLLSSLYSNTTIDYGFYYSSYDQIKAIGLCRGDVKPDDCRGCLKNSTSRLPQLCPNHNGALAWYDQCMLQYSNILFFGNKQTGPQFPMSSSNNVSTNDAGQFNAVLRNFLDKLKNEAAAGGSLRKYAAGNITAPPIETLYALVQCTPDLSQQYCIECLDEAFSHIPGGKEGGRILGPSCNFRFEKYSFFGSTVPLSTSPTTSKGDPLSTGPTTSKGNGGRGRGSTQTLIIIVVATVAFVVLIVSICIYLRVRSRPREKAESDTIDDEIGSVESLQFDFGTIRVATDDFSEANKLGQGGFGSVYKGKLYNGQVIAVKRLSIESGQGDLEFKNEVLLVAKLQHRNLVRLLGFCIERKERLLIYEFLPNASLDHFIFDPIKRVHLDWHKRYKIIEGIARGLMYLHEDSRLRIIHRDLKASNILLDDEINPKISDFGMAKLFLLDQTQANTSRIVGTYEYMAPEYAMHGQFSIKSDVFSFGVLLLEIVCGQRNNCFRNGENVEDLLSYAWTNWRVGTASHIIDPTLRNSLVTEIMTCIHIGLLCVQESVTNRPTMATIVLMLSSFSTTLPAPSRPAFFMHSNIESEYNLEVTGSDHSRGSYVQPSANEDSITELYPR